MDVRLLLICALADEQKEGRKEFLCVDGVAAKDGLENIALQLVLGGTTKAPVHLRASVTFTVCVCWVGGGRVLTWLWMSRR